MDIGITIIRITKRFRRKSRGITVIIDLGLEDEERKSNPVEIGDCLYNNDTRYDNDTSFQMIM